MLDEKTENILSVVIKECGTGYKILCDQDFGGQTDLDETLNRLAQSGYISLRYSAAGEYLVTPLYKAREYFEQKNSEFFLRGLLYKKVALFSFLGAFLGGLGIAVILLAVGWIYAV